MRIPLIIALTLIAVAVFAQQSLSPTEDLALVEVFVGDMEKNPRVKDIILFEGAKSKKSVKGITNQIGKFQVLLPEGDTYVIKIVGIGEEEDYSSIEIPAGPGMIESSIEILYEPAEVFTLNDVYFNTGKATLRSDSFKALNDLVEILEIKEEMKLEIAGHTDSVGEENANLKLSQERAQAVVDYLISKGISSNRLKAKGYGETSPIADNASPEGRQKNRRVEARIVE